MTSIYYGAEIISKIAEIYGNTNSLEGTYELFLKLKHNLEELEKENAALKQGIATLTAKNNLLQEECDSIVDTNEILSKEIRCLKEQNQELVEKIKKYEREQYKQIR